MGWAIEFDPRAERDLSRLDRPIQREIKSYLIYRIAEADDPRQYGHALTHNLSGLWRYRVRDYRILCHLQDDRLLVLILTVGHRSEVYDR